MELNREKVVKGLECCADENSCEGKCPYYGKVVTVCSTNLAKDSLALIKELTEENERLEAENEHLNLVVEGKLNRTQSLERLVMKLTEKNKTVQADTVRKMHTEIKERCIKGGIYPAFVARTIENVAKEMLEEGRDEE